MADGRHSDVFRYVICDVLTVAGRLINFVYRKRTPPTPLYNQR